MIPFRLLLATTLAALCGLSSPPTSIAGPHPPRVPTAHGIHAAHRAAHAAHHARRPSHRRLFYRLAPASPWIPAGSFSCPHEAARAAARLRASSGVETFIGR